MFDRTPSTFDDTQARAGVGASDFFRAYERRASSKFSFDERGYEPGRLRGAPCERRKRFGSPGRVDLAYPVSCEHKYEVGFGGPLGNPGDPDYREFSQVVEMSDGALHTVLVNKGECSLHGPHCKPSRGYESLVTCVFEDEIVRGGRGFLDLLILLEDQSSDTPAAG